MRSGKESWGDEDWILCLGSGNGRELGEKRRDWETGKVGGRLPYERGSAWVGLGEPFYLIHGALVDDRVHGRSPIRETDLETGCFPRLRLDAAIGRAQRTSNAYTTRPLCHRFEARCAMCRLRTGTWVDTPKEWFLWS